VKKKYEYVGPPGRHTKSDGTKAEVGEIIELDEQTASVLSDRFKLVEEKAKSSKGKDE
jgi:hypothetical protein